MLRNRLSSKGRLSLKRKLNNDGSPSTSITNRTVLHKSTLLSVNDTFSECLDHIAAIEQEASQDPQEIKTIAVSGLSPIPIIPKDESSLPTDFSKASTSAQRCLIPQEQMPDDSLQDCDLLAIAVPLDKKSPLMIEEDLFDEPAKPKTTLSDSGCEGISIDDEEEKPWEYSVYVKSPSTPRNCSRISKPSSKVMGVSKLASPNVPINKIKIEFSMQGLADINWDESMRCGDKIAALGISPSFSQKLQQQLLNNNNATPLRRKSCDSMSSVPEKNTFFGLPVMVKHLFEKFRGIKDLYDWQKECLSMPEVQKRSNLVYALPTSGGKTLVAEILLLKEILVNKKNTLFVLPYVSIVQEKVRSISQLAIELDFFVEEYAGGKGVYPPKKRRAKNAVFVATIEKALGIVHCLINENRLHEIGLVIVDELHLLGEGSRGATLESLLTNLHFSQGDIQIVGMSATIGNLPEIAAFLNAKTYTGDFRPVELKEYVKCGQTIYSIQRDLIGTDESPLCEERTLEANYSEEQLQSDPDQIGALAAEVVPDESCLVFCPSRKNCENVALLICQIMSKDLKAVRHEEKKALYKALVAEGNGQICPILFRTLPYGVAYHHSGLTAAERRLLEEAFLAQTLCLICCTSTLAAGVNLPARRVILRSPHIGRDFIDLSRYKQMVGRAGRAGFGGVGESILMCNWKETPKVLELLTSSMTETKSYLGTDGGAGLKALVLHSVSLRLASCRSDIHAFVKHTLLWVQSERLGIDVLKLADECIKALVSEGGFIISNEASCLEQDGNIITAEISNLSKPGNSRVSINIGLSTPLSLSKVGEAAVKGSFDMFTAHRLYDDLHLAQEKLILVNHLHLLYVVTPYSMIETIKYVNQVYFNVYMSLGSEELLVANALGITEAIAVAIMNRRPIKTTPQVVVDRFYLTLMLYDLWHQKSIWDVSKKFQVSRGQVFSLLQAASGFASCVLRYCEVLEKFWCFRLLLEEMVQRLSHCCSVELLPLMELPAVKIGRARQLYNAGYRNLRDVASAEPIRLVRELDHMPKKAAYQIVAAAKLLLIQKAESLRDEASEYLDGLSLNLKQAVTPNLK
ncbi:Helicase POLQ-like [Frankliniella fusca]|uniref:Helicase POLQ-like n=1 Tax=Frankliniella fusca TaxID=407009 RepID=A0AAE1GX13_9NEOP|nr:Helicase POLQ-like [Frankliniella fusca]